MGRTNSMQENCKTRDKIEKNNWETVCSCLFFCAFLVLSSGKFNRVLNSWSVHVQLLLLFSLCNLWIPGCPFFLTLLYLMAVSGQEKMFALYTQCSQCKLSGSKGIFREYKIKRLPVVILWVLHTEHRVHTSNNTAKYERRNYDNLLVYTCQIIFFDVSLT